MNDLRIACKKGDLEEVKALISDGHGHLIGLSLPTAIENEQLEIIQYLVKSCPTVDLIGQTDSDGYNSLHCAAYSKKNVQTLQWLIDNYNGDIKQIINHQTKYGETPLDYAYGYNRSPIKNDIVSLLRKYGGKANYYDKNGNYVGKGKGDLND